MVKETFETMHKITWLNKMLFHFKTMDEPTNERADINPIFIWKKKRTEIYLHVHSHAFVMLGFHATKK